MTAAAPALDLSVRPARPSDHAFIYDTFLRSFRPSDAVNGVPPHVFYETFKYEMARVLGAFTVLVAHPASDDDEIAGWLACKGNVVAWVYVKKDPWRRMGVARRLWEAAGLGQEVRALYGSWTMLELARTKGIRIRYATHVEAAVLLGGGQ